MLHRLALLQNAILKPNPFLPELGISILLLIRRCGLVVGYLLLSQSVFARRLVS
jgi:hypothetical protein